VPAGETSTTPVTAFPRCLDGIETRPEAGWPVPVWGVIGTSGSVGGGTSVSVGWVFVVEVGGVVVVVVVPVVVPPGPSTTTVPVMNGWRSQWNVYVPGVLNVQVPVQPGEVGWLGSGGTAPDDVPAVWVQLVG
jgi:hypothetical protein